MDSGDPYGSLDPRASAPRRGSEPAASRVLARGLLLACPRCGGRGLFVHPLKVRDRCPRCRLRLEREEGGFLGAMTLNFAMTVAAWLALLAIWLVIDLPDVQVTALTVASIVLMIAAPLGLWSVSKTLWAAIDYLVYRSDPDYASLDAADRASGNGGPH